jgi:hypothetical protein
MAKPRANPAMLLPSGVRVRRFVLPPLPITDESLKFYLSCSEFLSADPRSPAWLGFMLMSSSRRSASNEQHRDEISAALRSAVRRGVIKLIRHRDSKELFFARPLDIDDSVEILSDRLVPVPKAMRRDEPLPEPKPPPVVVNAPPPPPIRFTQVDAAMLAEIGTYHPFAISLYLKLRHDHADLPNGKHLTLYVDKLARKIGWPPTRVEQALRILVGKRLLRSFGREPTASLSSNGSYCFGRGMPSEVRA